MSGPIQRTRPSAASKREVTKISPLLPISILCITSAQAYKVIHKHCLGNPHGLATLNAICETGFERRYFASEQVNHGTCLLVESFRYAVENPVARVLLVEFAGLVAVVALVGLISANRSSAGPIVRWGTLPFLLMMQVVTGAVAIPIYFALIIYYSSSSARASFVPSGVARSLLPALVCGYVLPSIGLIVPQIFPTASSWEISAAVWQAFPVYVSLISGVLSFWFKNVRGAKTTSDAMMSTTFLVSTMDTVILGSILMHCYAVYLAYSQGITIQDFVPQVEMKSLTEVMHAVFTFDMLGFMIAIWTLLFYDTSRFSAVGRTPLAFVLLVFMAVFGTVLLGPGGAAALAWSNIEQARIGALIADRPPKKVDVVEVKTQDI